MNKKISKTRKYLLISAALCGIILIIISYCLTQRNESIENTYDGGFASGLEEKLSEMLENALGENAASVDVMITFKEKSIPSSKKNDNSQASFFQYSDTAALAVPEITGVMIVIKGTNSKTDFEIIRRAAATALGISQRKIYIIGGTTQ